VKRIKLYNTNILKVLTH